MLLRQRNSASGDNLVVLPGSEQGSPEPLFMPMGTYGRMVDYIDNCIPTKWNKTNVEEQTGETPFRRRARNIYVKRKVYAGKAKTVAFYTIIGFLALYFLLAVTRSLIPGPGPQTRRIIDSRGQEVEVWIPSLIHQESNLFSNWIVLLPHTNEFNSKKWVLTRKDVQRDTFTIVCDRDDDDFHDYCSTLPLTFITQGAVTVSISALLDSMWINIEAATHNQLVNSMEPLYGTDSVSCAIEYGVPLNIILVMQRGKGVPMIEPKLLQIEKGTEQTPTPHNIPTIIRNSNTNDGKFRVMLDETRATFEYLTPHDGKQAKILLSGPELHHVLFCIDMVKRI